MKKNIVKTTLAGGTAIVAGTIISCTNDSILYPIENNSTEVGTTKSTSTNCIAIPLSNENQVYVTAIQKLSTDIFQYPDLAKEFIKDPSLYFSQYGYNGKIDMEEGLIKLITAYADDQIRNAIQNKDLKTLVKLCQSKKLFNGSHSLINIPEKIEKALQEKGDKISVQPYSWFWFAEWIAVGVAWFMDLTAVNFETISMTHTEGIVASAKTIDTNNLFSMRLLWNITTRDTTIYDSNNMNEHIVDEIVSLLKDIRPELFIKNSEEEVHNQVKASLHGFLL